MEFVAPLIDVSHLLSPTQRNDLRNIQRGSKAKTKLISPNENMKNYYALSLQDVAVRHGIKTIWNGFNVANAVHALLDFAIQYYSCN